jgi:hypothetical protein
MENTDEAERKRKTDYDGDALKRYEGLTFRRDAYPMTVALLREDLIDGVMADDALWDMDTLIGVIRRTLM